MGKLRVEYQGTVLNLAMGQSVVIGREPATESELEQPLRIGADDVGLSRRHTYVSNGGESWSLACLSRNLGCVLVDSRGLSRLVFEPSETRFPSGPIVVPFSHCVLVIRTLLRAYEVAILVDGLEGANDDASRSSGAQGQATKSVRETYHSIEPPPQWLRALVALCEPLLRDGGVNIAHVNLATDQQIAQRLEIKVGSVKTLLETACEKLALDHEPFATNRRQRVAELAMQLSVVRCVDIDRLLGHR
jgi:hypothetical protein